MNSSHHFWNNDVRIFKAVILLALIATLFLPYEHAQWVGFGANVLWLFRS